MKTLYSSTFLSVILTFLILLGQSGQEIELVKTTERPAFKTIIASSQPAVNSSNKVQVEIFTSFGCPECESFALSTLKTLQEQYSTHEQVDFRVHLVPNKENEGELFAIKGAHCAGKFDRFWQMLEALYQEQALNRREVDLTAQGLQISILPFRACLDGDEFNTEIDQALERKNQLGITMIPSTLVNNILLIGNQPIENIEREIGKFQNQVSSDL